MDNKKQYKVNSFQTTQTKNGKEMWRISLEGLEDKKPLTGVIWSEDIPRFDGTKFRAGNIITFLGQDYNSNYNSVVVKNVTVVKEALTGLPKGVVESCLSEIVQCLNTIEERYTKEPTAEDPHTHLPLALLARELLKDVKRPEFSTTPAAEKYHHNYIGGLLKHTYEVLQIVRHLATMFPIENIDALQLAAILHDLGKMCEYKTDLKLGTASIDEEWQHSELSHTHWGYRYAHDCGAFDVARMVASHHGRIEWGAIFEPVTPEEKLLHLADMASTTVGITTIDKLEAVLTAVNNSKDNTQKKEEATNVHPTSDEIL